MLENLLLAVLIIAIAVALLSVRVILVKGGRFKSYHIHDSQAMRDRGIHCVIDQDKELRYAKEGKIKTNRNINK